MTINAHCAGKRSEAEEAEADRMSQTIGRASDSPPLRPQIYNLWTYIRLINNKN